MHFTNNNCRYIVRDDVTLKDIVSILIRREILHYTDRLHEYVAIYCHDDFTRTP